jgi:site-specific recombinase XerD
VFVSERGTPFSSRGFQAIFNMKIHPHMLRHSCGYKLANDGVDTRTIQSYLGHKSIQHTVRYPSWRRPALKAYFGISM